MKHSIITMLLFLIVGFGIFSCSNSVTDTSDDQITENKDVAEASANSIGLNNGGATDQISDLLSLATPNSKETLKNGNDGTFDMSYNSQSGIWTIVVTRERGDSLGLWYASISRTYTLQYLSKDNISQPQYITAGDTARTIKFNIERGSGKHKTPKISQELDSLHAEWIATHTNTDIVTINGTYYRATADTIKTFNKTRTHDHNLNLNFTDIKGPRGSALDIAQKISGIIFGHYHADVTFQNGSGYGEKTIDRDIYVVLGNGTGDIKIEGNHYTADILTGTLK